MAAHSNNFIRVRLHFDYAPPGAVSCRMCWLLVDLNTCRVVSDLESLIRQKFELSRRSILSLFVEDCYLPHTESIYVVRDNDCVRVKVDSVAQVTGHGTSPGSSKENCRKRRRPEAGDENQEERKTELENGFELKKKKRKKHKKDGEQQALSEETKRKKQHKEKKKQKEAEEAAPAAPSKPAPAKKTPVEEQSKSIKKPPVTQLRKQTVSSSDSSSSSSEEDAPPKKTPTPKPPTKTPATPSKPALTATKTPVNVQERSQSTKKPPVTQLRKQNVSSSDSSSSSEDDVPPKKTPTLKPPMKTPDASKKPPNSIPAKKAPPSSSSSSDSSSDDAVSSKKTPINTPVTSTLANGTMNTSLPSTAGVQGPTLPPDSNSEDEIKLVIRRPVQQPGGGVAGGLPPWRGRGRGKARPGRGRGGAFRGRGFDFSYHGDNDQSHSGDSQTNVSAVLQNGEQTAPKRDYSALPLLAAPPQVGQNIAFMLLELTESYTPEVSEYKEAKIVNFDPTTKQIELELLNATHAPVEPGKFDLVYQNPDGSERVEYAVARSSRVTERWDALLEPRLII